MATFLSYLGTPLDPAIKEDLLDVIENIDPINNFLVSNLPTSTTNSVYHQWLEDNLPSVTAGTVSSGAARAENFTPTWDNASGVARKANYTQIVASDFQVSRTQQLVDKAGIADRMAYEQDRAMKHWGNMTENSLLHATLSSGTASGTARRMQGLKWFASLTSNISGVSLSETIFNNVMRDAVAKGNQWDTVIVPLSFKSRISGFTAGATKFIDATDKKLVNLVDVYESDWGVVKIIPHRQMLSGEILFLQRDKTAIAYLDRPHFEDYAKTTDGMNGLIRGELTTEVRNGYGVGWYLGML